MTPSDKALVAKLRINYVDSSLAERAASRIEALSADLERVTGEWDEANRALDSFHEHKGWTANYVAQRLFDEKRSAEAERDALATKVYQPGIFKCAKCNFQLVQQSLNANTGSVTARDAVGEKCPNDGSPMWRVSYQEDNAKAWAWGEEQFDLRQTAEAEVKRLREALKGVVSLAGKNLVAGEVIKAARQALEAKVNKS